MKKNIYFFLLGLFLCILCFIIYENLESQEEKIDKTHLDISTPEKTVHYFYEAFRIGDDDLLSRVLVDGALLSEFNPEQIITVPNPMILDAKIKKKIVVKKLHSGFDGSIQIGDILIYVLVEKDQKMTNKEYPGMALLDDKSCFLIRIIENKCLILAIYPGWPNFDEKKKVE